LAQAWNQTDNTWTREIPAPNGDAKTPGYVLRVTSAPGSRYRWEVYRGGATMGQGEASSLEAAQREAQSHVESHGGAPRRVYASAASAQRRGRYEVLRGAAIFALGVLLAVQLPLFARGEGNVLVLGMTLVSLTSVSLLVLLGRLRGS
jgi:hypothetical protein